MHCALTTFREKRGWGGEWKGEGGRGRETHIIGKNTCISAFLELEFFWGDKQQTSKIYDMIDASAVKNTI